MKEMCDGVVETAGNIVIFVWVSACRRALPGDRIAVDTAETGEQQPPRAGRISSKSVVSRSGGVCVIRDDYNFVGNCVVFRYICVGLY